ncbi:retrovirus-related pol polyprotein from transposon 17.6 [Plakobranchus ocellatus]|uniref:Retrovirus-related pol polyprotein from transposon 17.6 n=1 Tax=Plakobranchus ocellatus TaxID=259542 RepID=A0AAV4CWE8_9GAST|nr:retrovirus-related pol polyprotein from transposon 17.6 [Plakobranchus ocellatus]
MVHAILDCAAYLRGRHFILQCDHQCLKPLFQKQFRGAIYERWLTILQQFDFQIVYKPAAEMSVPDALSRCAPQNQPEHEIDSPSEHDPHFPYVHEKPSVINLPTGQTLRDVLNVSDSDVNNLIPNGQPDFSVNPTPNIVSVVNISSSQIHSIDSSSQFCTPNPFSVLLIDDYDADTENEASDSRHRNGIRPQSVNAVTAVSVTNKKKRKSKRMGKQASRPDDVPMQSAIPSTSRSVIDASGSNLSKSCQSNVSSDTVNDLPPSDDQETECYYDCLDTLPSNQTDSSLECVQFFKFFARNCVNSSEERSRPFPHHHLSGEWYTAILSKIVTPNFIKTTSLFSDRWSFVSLLRAKNEEKVCFS